ncbi:MAG TPA: N-acetylneuraminate synthase family protein [Candidatus Rifleibacterium sp.]|nr:N-acetylneuraminate synthase family protein [Candidatus Rifleibacterium sp.]
MQYNFRSKKLKRLFEVTEDAPVYTICEIGINHNGKLDIALRLIDAAALAGVDAVKFQKRCLPAIYSKSILENSNNSEWSFDYLIPILKECELSEDDYFEIKKRCDNLGLDLIITPFDEISVEFVKKLSPAAIKIASADMTNLALITKAASLGEPLIISTGMWEEEDIAKCVAFYNRENICFALLHTQSTYPAPYGALNLNFLNRLKDFASIIGYSGHERGIFIPVAAVAMGCKIIEKHITFDKNEKGPDHKASLLPSEWVQMIEDIKNLEQALGKNKEVTQAELLNKEAFAKSAVAKVFIPKGHILTFNDVVFMSPGKGIFQHEMEQYIGRPLIKSIESGCYISKFDFEAELGVEQWKSFNFSKKWGLKCRFHDFSEIAPLNLPIVEFHCSQNDLEVDFKGFSEKSELYVHAPEIFDRELVDICSEDLGKVERSLSVLQRSIEKTILLAKNFPAAKPKLVMHLGGMLLDQANILDTRPMMERAVKNFLKLDYPRDLLEILPENLPPRPWYLGGEWFQHAFVTAEDMLFFCKEASVNLTFDICHAHLYCRYAGVSFLDYTVKIKPFICHLHISDAGGISGEGLQIGEGEVDFANFFDLVKDINFSWVPEIWSGHLHHGAGFYAALNEMRKFEGAL